MEKIMKFPAAGQTATKGYPGEMIKYTIDKQFSEKELWKLTVNQYRTKPDGEDGGWRGYKNELSLVYKRIEKETKED